MTSASSVLAVASNVTLTVKGNIGHVNGSTHTQQAGSTVTFDNSASGGSPIYTFINVGFSNFNFNGSSGSLVTIQAIAGQSAGMGVPWANFTATYGVFRRINALGTSNNLTSLSISDSTFDTCGRIRPTSTSATINIIFDRNTFIAGTHSTEDLNLSVTTAATSGTRRIFKNTFSKSVTYNAKSFSVTGNYFASGFASVAGSTWTFRLNFVKQDGSLNGGNGQLFPSSLERNYFVVDNLIGNPHFVAPTALLSADTIVSQNIFEAHTPDLIDTGDSVLVNATATSGGNKIIGRNNIVLINSYPSVSVTSGTLLTAFGAGTSATEWYRNTANVNDSIAAGKRGMFAFSEGGSSTTLNAMKSNLGWGSSATQGYLGERVAGTTKDLILAAGADYNWTFNLSAGDNQRGYEDRLASNALWTAGDAVAAGVDVHQGTGDPQFYDSARNLASWTAARGYGSTYTDGLTAIQADPARTADLINYIFEGFRPANASLRNAAHDGGIVGAANFYKARSTSQVTAHRAGLSKFGL
jgi:hypothetical protein